MASINVKFNRLGSGILELNLPEGSDLAALLEKAEIDVEKFSIRVNGTPAASTATPMQDGDVVVAVPEVKGGLQ